MYNANPEDFHTCLVTGDETWLHHWDPDTKKESMQWKCPGLPPPKKFRTQPLASKVMATVFWDSKGIILIDYKPTGTSITGEYYADVIKQLRVAIKEQEAHGPRFAQLSDITTADMQMLCNIFPILSSQLMKISSFEQFLVLKKNIWA